MAGETLPTGSTNTQGLADWAAPYITNYLGKAQALSETPYQTYQGPLTADASQLQTDAFKGIGALTIGNRGTYKPVGGSFTDQYSYPSGMTFGDSIGTMGGTGLTDPTTGAIDSGTAGSGGMGGGSGGFNQPRSVAEQYMNPYLQQAIDPQLRELQRQSNIQRVQDAGRLTQAGAFGGSRQAIMESEGRRNLLGKQSDVLGQGYATAYDKAMQQYNAEQARKIQEAQFGADFGLKGLAAEQGILKDQLNAGGVERGITAEGVAADLAEFEKQRQYPYQQVQFQRDMISGLPTGSVTNTPGQLSGVGQLLSVLGGGTAAASALGYKNVGELLSALGLNVGQKES